MAANLTPYILSEDERAQAGFYAQALGGEIVSVKLLGEMAGAPEHLKDKVMHMVLRVAGENLLFLSDFADREGGGRRIALALTYADEHEAREAFGKLEEGGTVKEPFILQPWGAFYGEIVDNFGITWQIVKM